MIGASTVVTLGWFPVARSPLLVAGQAVRLLCGLRASYSPLLRREVITQLRRAWAWLLAYHPRWMGAQASDNLCAFA